MARRFWGSRRWLGRWPVFSVSALVVLALVVGGAAFLGYEYVGTNLLSQRAASSAKRELQAQWPTVSGSQESASASRTPVAWPSTPGTVVALIRIPALGSNWEYPVLVGTDPATLAKGVGWYAGSAAPGQLGNCALAGERVTHGEAFRHLLDLGVGATVIIETQDRVYTYALDVAPRTLSVTAADSWVLDPVPGRPNDTPTKALITLTTAQDLIGSGKRSVAFGHLVSTTSK